MSLSVFFRECRQIVVVGMPIFIAQLTQIGMNVVDTLMAGQYSAEALAAIAVAGSIWFPLTLLAVGCLLALPGMSAQLAGARQPERAVHLLHQGLVLGVLLSVFLASIIYCISWRLDIFALDARLASMSGEYMRALLPGIPAFLLFVVNRSYLEGYALTRPAMLVSIFALLANIPCNYAFIYGRWGMPELGATGCGVATSICFWIMACALVAYARMFARRHVSLAEQPFVLDRGLVASIVRIGLPNAFSICLESSLYALTALLLAPLGAIVVAGHQVTMSYAGVVFTVPLAIGMTSTIRVGQYLGASKVLHARMAALGGIGVGLLCAMLTTFVTIVFREDIVHLYNNDAAVLALACDLMLLCAAYQVFDVLQIICCGILRGYNDTRIISVVCSFAYGVIGLPGGYVLARTDWLVPAMGAAGFWVGYLLALLCSASAFLWRVRTLHRLDMATVRGMLVH